MNARTRADHPVKTTTAGRNPTARRIFIAKGALLLPPQGDISLGGHAIDERLTAGKPARDAMPGPGRVAQARRPSLPGLRAAARIPSP